MSIVDEVNALIQQSPKWLVPESDMDKTHVLLSYILAAPNNVWKGLTYELPEPPVQVGDTFVPMTLDNTVIKSDGHIWRKYDFIYGYKLDEDSAPSQMVYTALTKDGQRHVERITCRVEYIDGVQFVLFDKPIFIIAADDTYLEPHYSGKEFIVGVIDTPYRWRASKLYETL